MAVDHGEREFRFCPHCGGAFNARILKDGDPARLVCDRCGFVFYLDPKVAVGTIIRMADDEIVLCRRAIAPGYGRWVFPGGYVDRGERLEEAAVREAREECGLDVELEGLVSLHSYRGKTPIVIVWAARVVGGELKVADEESLEVRTFGAETIPWDDLAFESTGEALRAYFENRDSGFGTDADGTTRRTQMIGTRATAVTMAIGLAILAAACVEARHEGPTSPSEVAKVLATGSWTSAATAASSSFNVGSCGNVEWKITSMTDSSASGTFKTTCGGGLTLAGSAEGKLTGRLTAELSASGTATGEGVNCAFSLAGTAVPEGLDSIRVNYSGTTCLGPVSGSELLKKR